VESAAWARSHEAYCRPALGPASRVRTIAHGLTSAGRCWSTSVSGLRVVDGLPAQPVP
jgi:hypothetical protein